MEHTPEPLETLRGVPRWAALDDEQTMDDLCTVRGSDGPLSEMTRARLYRAIADPRRDTWADARLIVVDHATGTTMWLAAVRWAGFSGRLMERIAPSAQQVRAALNAAAVHVRARSAYERSCDASEPSVFEGLSDYERDYWYRRVRQQQA